MKPRLHVEQKLTAFTNLYRVFGSGPEGAKTSLISYAQQKRISLKEKITFYADEEKSREIFTLRAEKVFDVHGKYMVEAEGQTVGVFKKEFKQSLANSTWTILDGAGNEKFRVKESSMALAIARRFAGWIPYVGDIIDLLLNFLRYHFVFIDIATGEEVGKYQKTTLFRDHYTLHMTDQAFDAIDWRTLAAFSVGLDALQSR